MAIVPLGGGDTLITADPVVEETLPAAEAAPEIPAAPTEAGFPVEALSAAVREWIIACQDTAPPASQLHFSLHLFNQFGDLEDRFRALG